MATCPAGRCSAGDGRLPNRSSHPDLERQLRLQEDEIYRLRAKIEEYQDGDSYCPRRPKALAIRRRIPTRRGFAAQSAGPGAPNGEPKPQIDIEIPASPPIKSPTP